MMSIERLGWVLAAAVAGVMLASGFQGSIDKVASVDLSNLVANSDRGKANQADFDKMKSNRETLLKFIDETRVLTVQQANDLRTIWTKETPTTADTQTMERMKADIVAMGKRNQELSGKANLSPEERTLLQEYASRSAAMEQLTASWLEEFRQEVQQWAQGKQVDTNNRAKAASQEVAKAQGFTLVFDTSVAVYAANDLTADALKAMNAKK